MALLVLWNKEKEVFDIEKLKVQNNGKGFIRKYIFPTLDDWDKFKEMIEEEQKNKPTSHPWGIHKDDWIEPDRMPFMLLHIYEGAGWHSMEFVYPDDFPKIYVPSETFLKEEASNTTKEYAGTITFDGCGSVGDISEYTVVAVNKPAELTCVCDKICCWFEDGKLVYRDCAKPKYAANPGQIK